MVARIAGSQDNELHITLAEQVVRGVRGEQFGPMATEPPLFAEDFAAICQDDQFGVRVATSEARGSSEG